MLQSIRDNSQSIVAKIIVGLIIVTFALFGVESLVSLSTGAKAPATVNGEDISEQEVYQATELQRRQLLMQMGNQADPALLDDELIRPMVLDSLIEQKALLLAGEAEGMLVSDTMLDQMIVSTPQFQVDGKFNAEQFEAVLRSSGLSPLGYRQLLAREKLLEQQQLGYQLSAFSVPTEVNRIAALDRQTRSGHYFILQKASVAADITITDAALEQRFAAEPDAFKTPEQVVVNYIVLDKAGLRDQVEVEESQINSAYDQLKAEYADKEQRHAAHILIEVNGDDAAALEKAQQLKQRLDQGEDFAALAKSESDDLGSAEQGGDLGQQAKGVFSEPFEQALFSMQVGAVSEPIKTEFGYHLIKLLDVNKPEVPALTEVHAQLKEQVIDQQVERLYVERMETLADMAFSSADLVEPAEALGLSIQTSEPFSRSGGSGMTANPRVIKAAFSHEALEESLNSAPIELDQQQTVVLHVQQHLPARAQTLEEVADDLRQQMQEQLIAERLQQLAETRKQALLAGEALSKVAVGKAMALVDVDRAGADLPQEVVNALFAMPHPQKGQPSIQSIPLADGNQAVILLNKVTTPAEVANEQEQQALAAFLAAQTGEQEYQALVATIKDNAEVEKN